MKIPPLTAEKRREIWNDPKKREEFTLYAFIAEDEDADERWHQWDGTMPPPAWPSLETRLRRAKTRLLDYYDIEPLRRLLPDLAGDNEAVGRLLTDIAPLLHAPRWPRGKHRLNSRRMSFYEEFAFEQADAMVKDIRDIWHRYFGGRNTTNDHPASAVAIAARFHRIEQEKLETYRKAKRPKRRK